MYLYRAINNREQQCLLQGRDLPASIIDRSEFFQSAAKHISSGSNNNQRDCWISTTKDFKICASEYAIPQMGAYNTTQRQKEIIVISRMYWINNSNYNFNGNFTVFTDLNNQICFDLGDAKTFPIPVKMHRYRYITVGNKQVKVNNKLQVQQINTLLNGMLNGADMGLFDMAFPSKSDRKNIIPTLNEFSMLDYIDKGIVGKCAKQPIASGIMKKSKEVLALNNIPYNAIIKKLSKIEICVLYALSNNHFLNVLNDLISGDLLITLNNTNVTISSPSVKNIIPISQYEHSLLSDLLIDMVCNQWKPGGDIEQDYKILKRDKIQILNKVIQHINPSYTVQAIQDDKVFVHKIDFNNITPIDKLHSYDVLAIQDVCNNIIYSYSNPNYNQILKKLINK